MSHPECGSVAQARPSVTDPAGRRSRPRKKKARYMNARCVVLLGGFSSSFCIDHREFRGLSAMTDAQPRPPGIRMLVCSSGVPHETEGASVVLFFHYIRRLQQAGYDIVHLLLLEGMSWPQSAVSDYAATMKRSGAFQVEVV